VKRAVATAVVVFALMSTTGASADAVVNVHVRGGADGQVQLSGDAGTFTCTTSQGSCTIRSVPGGRYVVVFKPKGGSSTAPKKVMIPPDGKADLHIAAK
jgi:type 1 fimbria pilin